MNIDECIRYLEALPENTIIKTKPTSRHFMLLKSYSFNIGLGHENLRALFVNDIKSAIDIGATDLAVDLLLTFRLYLKKYQNL